MPWRAVTVPLSSGRARRATFSSLRIKIRHAARPRKPYEFALVRVAMLYLSFSGVRRGLAEA